MNYTIGTRVFQNWEITREIGEGSYGKVFVVEKNEFGISAKSALKVITIPKSVSDIKSALSDGMDEKSVTTYFRGVVQEIVQECATMSTLKSCENVVHFEDYTVLEHEGAIGWDILIRMELLTELNDHQRKHAMSEADVIKMSRDLCTALVFCRKKAIIHRDIKPENIFVSDSGAYKLGDFGVAKTVEKTTGASKKGTESYMAPEVYLSQPYGESVDIYSLGLVMYKLTNRNRLPFYPPSDRMITYSDKENALQRRIGGEVPPPPIDASAALSDIILKAISADRADRFQNAGEMLAALNRLNTSGSASESFAQSSPDLDDTDKTTGFFGDRRAAWEETAKKANEKPPIGDQTVEGFASKPSQESSSENPFDSEKQQKSGEKAPSDDIFSGSFNDMPGKGSASSATVTAKPTAEKHHKTEKALSLDKGNIPRYIVGTCFGVLALIRLIDSVNPGFNAWGLLSFAGIVLIATAMFAERARLVAVGGGIAVFASGRTLILFLALMQQGWPVGIIIMQLFSFIEWLLIFGVGIDKKRGNVYGRLAACVMLTEVVSTLCTPSISLTFRGVVFDIAFIIGAFLIGKAINPEPKEEKNICAEADFSESTAQEIHSVFNDMPGKDSASSATGTAKPVRPETVWREFLPKVCHPLLKCEFGPFALQKQDALKKKLKFAPKGEIIGCVTGIVPGYGPSMVATTTTFCARLKNANGQWITYYIDYNSFSDIKFVRKNDVEMIKFRLKNNGSIFLLYHVQELGDFRVDLEPIYKALLQLKEGRS